MNFEYVKGNSKHTETRFRVKHPGYQRSGLLKSSSLPELNDVPTGYSKCSIAGLGEPRGKYSRELLFLTNQLPSSRGLHSSVQSSPSRPSTAELRRRSLIRCGSLSDDFQQVILHQEGKDSLHCRLQTELVKSRPQKRTFRRSSSDSVRAVLEGIYSKLPC